VYFSSAKQLKKALQSDALITRIVDHIEISRNADIRILPGSVISISEVPYLEDLEAVWVIKVYGVLPADLYFLKRAIEDKIGGKWSDNTLLVKQFATEEVIELINEKQEVYRQQETLSEAVQYATSLTSGKDGQPGRPGRDGRDGKDGKDGKDGRDGIDGRDGKDLDATETRLKDLQDVSFDTLELTKGQVLTWDGIEWTNRYVPQLQSIGAGVPENINLDSITFNTDVEQYDPAQGNIHWEIDESTLVLGLDEAVHLHLGQDTYMLVRNDTTSIIPKGVAVMFTGTLGASGRIKVAPMVADGTYPGYVFLGVTAEAINPSEDGFAISYGKLKNINTSIYPEGSILWCNPSSPGGFTITEPVAPNLKLPVAAVVSSKNNGTLMIRWDTGRNLKDLGDVEANGSKQDGDALKWVAANNRWEPKKSVEVQATGQITFEAISNTQLVVKYTGTDAVTRSTTLTLSA
jgi:hypothetical protein